MSAAAATLSHETRSPLATIGLEVRGLADIFSPGDIDLESGSHFAIRSWLHRIADHLELVETGRYQEDAPGEDAAAAPTAHAEEPGPLWAIATDLEEAAALLRGVLDGLEKAIDVYPEPRLTHMRILLDRFDVELARVEKQMHAVYARNAGTDKAKAGR